MKIKKCEFSFKEIDSQERFNAIVENIYNIVSLTFVGFKKSDLRDTIQNPLNEDVRALMVLCDDKTVGFVIVQRISLEVGARKIIVFKSMAGIHPDHRRKVNLSSYAIEVVLKYKMRFPLSEIYCFGLFIHPSVYYIFQRVCYDIYPHHQKETPEHHKQLIYLIAEKIGYIVTDANKLIGETPLLLKSIESTKIRDYWYDHSSPYVADYIKRTKYKEGTGVFTLVPFTWKNIFMTILKMISSKFLGKKAIPAKKMNPAVSDE